MSHFYQRWKLEGSSPLTSIVGRVGSRFLDRPVTSDKGGFIQNATANAVCVVGLSKTN